MSTVIRFMRWLSGSEANDAARISQALQELQEAVEENRNNQRRLLQYMRTDQRKSEKALRNAVEALMIAKRIGAKK